MIRVTELEVRFGAPDVFGVASVIMFNCGLVDYFSAAALTCYWARCFILTVASRVVIYLFL